MLYGQPAWSSACCEKTRAVLCHRASESGAMFTQFCFPTSFRRCRWRCVASPTALSRAVEILSCHFRCRRTNCAWLKCANNRVRESRRSRRVITSIIKSAAWNRRKALTALFNCTCCSSQRSDTSIFVLNCDHKYWKVFTQQQRAILVGACGVTTSYVSAEAFDQLPSTGWSYDMHVTWGSIFTTTSSSSSSVKIEGSPTSRTQATVAVLNHSRKT